MAERAVVMGTAWRCVPLLSVSRWLQSLSDSAGRWGRNRLTGRARKFVCPGFRVDSACPGFRCVLSWIPLSPGFRCPVSWLPLGSRFEVLCVFGSGFPVGGIVR